MAPTVKKGDTKSPEPPSATTSELESKQDESSKTTTTEPLAPPPRPAVANAPDYFSANHGHLAHEQNPFEYSFANGNQTPGGSTKLPSVAALTSPAGFNQANTPNFWGASLRSGPLSPAMLSAPQTNDYFGDGHHLRGGFPTPNESGLRSGLTPGAPGLTPGGSGSMFPSIPEPSPSVQKIFESLRSADATPGTVEFHRTALSAAEQRKRSQQQHITSDAAIDQALGQPILPNALPGAISGDLLPTMDAKPVVPGRFDGQEANDAANGLFLLAQAHSGPQQTNHYTMAPQMAIQPVHAHPSNLQMGGPSTDTSPQVGHRNGGSISTQGGGSGEMSGFSDTEQQNTKRATRGNGKRATKDVQTNGRRKVNDTPSKGPPNKKAKGNNGAAMSMSPEPEEELDMSKDQFHANGKKMTDEDKRKNFLERNRVAALKCRQRKKQWLANLQTKVEVYSAENESLQQQMSGLREEIVHLKTILLAHKDCPVSQQQGLAGHSMHQHLDGGYTNNMNPYGMAQIGQQPQQQNQMIAGAGMQRRYS